MNRKEYKVIKNIFSGNRATIQERAAIKSLFEIQKFI